MYKFTIITVTKNNRKGLSSTIKSVAKQTYNNYEYILIDGESIDGSIDVLKAYKKYINKTVIEKDQGIFDAMNKGISLAKGDYILFLNAGDHFTTPYSIAAINKKVELIKAKLYFGKILWVDTINYHVITSKHEHIRYKSHLLYDNFPQPATIYTRKAFEKVGIFDLKFPVYADYEWNLRALIKHNLSFYYGDFIVTTFYTGGISTNQENFEAKYKEKKRIKQLYFNNFIKKKKLIKPNIFSRIKFRLNKEHLNKI